MTTNSKFNTAEVVRFVDVTAERLIDENIDLSPALLRAVRERFPEMTVEQYHRALDVWRDEIEAARAEREAEHECHKTQHDIMEQIFAGLENVVKNFEEACRIKAQGEGPVAEAARRWLIAMDGVMARLSDAAHKAHPDFVETTKGHYRYTGPGDMPSEDALIEWFQINHPTQARAIEAVP
jgi:hypothetical protein